MLGGIRTKSSQVKINDIEETEDAIFQRLQLNLVREFLLAEGAPLDLVDAIDTAIEDIESWIDPSIEIAMGAALPRFSSTRD